MSPVIEGATMNRICQIVASVGMGMMLTGVTLPAASQPPGLIAQVSAEQFYRMGLEQSNRGEYREAIASFEQAIQLNPVYAEAYFHQGIAYSKLGDFENAISSFDRAIEINPDYAEAHFQRGWPRCSWAIGLRL
ncbi:tetratricopeptide repeat protein [Egbenema bharatensis]|uniref:tetratricopeptide repeat protein n=1 Tax=Egbenema bharatensis TaxID=3463334 RepID=UPI003A882B2D